MNNQKSNLEIVIADFFQALGKVESIRDMHAVTKSRELGKEIIPALEKAGEFLTSLRGTETTLLRCSVCSEWLELGSPCKVCIERDRAAHYAQNSIFLRECLKHIATFDEQPVDFTKTKVDAILEKCATGINVSPDYRQIISDCLLTFTLTSELLSLLVAFNIDLPAPIEREIKRLNEHSDRLEEKWLNMQKKDGESNGS